jgi:phosphate-selective porin
MVVAPLAMRAQSAPASLEERLNALEQKVQTLSRENAELRDKLGVKKDAAAPVLVKPAGKETSLSVGGFLQAQAEFGRASDPRFASGGAAVRDRFYFRRARISVAGVFAEDFDFKAELDLQGNTLGASTGNLARANEVFVNWHRYEAANVRFGQLKPAFGAEALLSDTKTVAIERSLSNDRLTDGRQMAVAVAGTLLDKQLGYYVVAGNGNGANVSANDNSKFQRSARVTWSPILPKTAGKLTLGADGLWTQDVALAKSDFGFTGNLFTGKRAMNGVDAQWSWQRLDLSAEWLRGTFEPSNATPRAKLRAEGWQATAAFFLVPGKLQGVVRYDAFDPNTAAGGNTFHTTLFGLNYLIKGEDLRLMIDYLDGHVPGAKNDGGRLLTRLQVVF